MTDRAVSAHVTNAPLDLGELVARSPAPGLVKLAIERVGAAQPALVERLAADPEFARRFVAVTAASRSLTTLLETDDTAADRLIDLEIREPVDASSTESLAAWKRREYLRIAARDLTGVDQLEATGSALSRMAGEVLHAACLLEQTRGLAIIAMGKLAGDELNYASDVDVIFVGDGQPEDLADQARSVLAVAGRCFRVDTELRPEGRQGALVRTLLSYEAYWDRWAEPWEFQALLKHRAIAGDLDVGDEFSAKVSERLWGREWTAEDLRSLRHIKSRVEAEVTRKGMAEREVKRGPGGIRDVEFSVQLLQLVHGRSDPALRNPNTLAALYELDTGGYVALDDAVQLADSYRFLRKVEHRLQLVDERQTHTLPNAEEALRRLALVMGHADDAHGGATDHFREALRAHRTQVRRIHQELWFRPLLEAFAAPADERTLDDDTIAARLRAAGFVDVDRTAAAVRELTSGLTRSSRLMTQLMPLILDWLADSPDPDLGLLGFRHLAGTPERQQALIAAFRDSPEVARRLAVVLGTGRLFSEMLPREPDLVTSLGSVEDTERDLERDADRLAGSDPDDLGARLRRFRSRELVRTAAADVLGLWSIEQVQRRLNDVAEAICRVALDRLEADLPFAIIAAGRFGGGELGYSSDLDVLFVYDGEGPHAQEQADRLAKQWRDLLRGDLPAHRIYDIDLDLRPEGKDGLLTRSLEGYVRYHETLAEVWERQAMIRARPVAGDPALGRRWSELIDKYVWDTPLTDDDAREIRRIKARVETERIPPGEDRTYHLKLGPGSLSDIEWTAQLLQLRTGVRGAGTTEVLAALVAAGALDPADREILETAYRFCEQTRNRLFLVAGRPRESLPAAGSSELTHLAISLGLSSRDLRETYRRVTRRAREVTERLFYGMS